MPQIKAIITLSFTVFAASVFLFQHLVPEVSARPGSSLAPPTGVTATDGDYANKVGVEWDAIRGAVAYRIFRSTGSDAGSAIDLGTTAANYFFDASAVAGQPYFYWVRAENEDEMSELSSFDEGFRGVAVNIPGVFEPLEPPFAPVGNEVTATKAFLGKALFWDEQLSSTKTVACGTCHRPATGGADPRSTVESPESQNPGFDNMFGTDDDVVGSAGVPQNAADGNYYSNWAFGLREQVTGRKSPSYLNAGYSPSGLFWDGRALDEFRDQLTNSVLLSSGASLESQSAGPPLSTAEMAHVGRNWSQVAERVRDSRPLALASNIPTPLMTWIGERTYPELFLEAFGTDHVTPARIAMAIAAYERTLFSDRTPFDRWAAGLEPLTQQEENGMIIFQTASCDSCHTGALMTGHQFFNIGVRPQFEDRGRGAVTGEFADDAKFKTPTLRNIELHGSYMHNGRFPSLGSVVDFYDRGGDFEAPNRASAIRPLGLTMQEKMELIAFLRRPMTDPRVANELPPFDRPQLYSESDRVPKISGLGRSLLAGGVPEVVAIEPPMLGNQNFTVAVSVTPRAGKAVLVINDSDPGILTAIPTTASFLHESVEIISYGNRGYASASISIPDDPALIGKKFFGRWYVQDVRARGRIGVSRLFTFTIFKPETAPTVFGPIPRYSSRPQKAGEAAIIRF